MKKRTLLVIGFLIMIVIILLINNSSAGGSEIKALVLEADNSEVVSGGITNLGVQYLEVKILEGKYEGETFIAQNHLNGNLEIDNYFETNDRILVAILEKEGQVKTVQAIDLYRWPWEVLLFVIFALALLLYAGKTGLRALISFVTSLYIIWNVLVKGLLAGQNPLLLSFLALFLLSAIIIFSIAGFSKKGLAAFAGTLSGLVITIFITIFFGEKLGLQGMTAPFSQTLLFSGHLDLNMKHIFYAAIIIGASGAAMDIAMDIAASIEEIKIKRPDIEMWELIESGFNIGRAVIGTMTTTLLLAYSGGYLTLLMLFMSKNTNLDRMMNFKMVSAEILRTVSGSIGLVLVAPITAIFAGWIFSRE